VKKLPQPCKLVVVGGLKKTLVLHFECARTGQTVTTETSDWNQWCKVGFGLIKLGKCAVEAAAGNPMALAGGVGAISDVYKGYKTKDDADFNTFISQPFLTSAESDKLINQLRAGGFFEKMTYDPQEGNWVLNGTLTAEETAKKEGKNAARAGALSNQEQVKGTNFGLGKINGSVISGLANAAGSVAGSVATVEASSGDGSSNGFAAMGAEHAGSVGKGAAFAVDMSKKKSGGSAAKSILPPPLKYADRSKEGSAAKATPPPAPMSGTSPKKSFFGSMFGSSKQTASDPVAAQRIMELEQRVTMLEAKMERVLNATENGFPTKSV